MTPRWHHHMVPRRVGLLSAGIWSLLASGEVAGWTFALTDLLRAHHGSN